MNLKFYIGVKALKNCPGSKSSRETDCIRLSEKFLSFDKVMIDEQQFVLYYFIELRMIHFYYSIFIITFVHNSIN